MHPTPSVIIFTALSGLGFGLLVFLGLQMPDVTGGVAFIFLLSDLGWPLVVLFHQLSI